jgi:hypothetical protein
VRFVWRAIRLKALERRLVFETVRKWYLRLFALRMLPDPCTRFEKRRRRDGVLSVPLLVTEMVIMCGPLKHARVFSANAMLEF